MKDDFQLLRQKAINGFLLCIELFNRPWNQGRVDAVLIMLGHACEMLLKAGIVRKGGEIHDKKKNRNQGKPRTFSMADCILSASAKSPLCFLSDNHAVSLRVISSYRNAAQHYHIEVSENLLYCLVGNGIGVLRNVMPSVFGEDPQLVMPRRVLSIASAQPVAIVGVVADDMREIKKGLTLKGGERINALAQIRGLAAMENALLGNDSLPDNAQLGELCKQISNGIAMDAIFPGIISIGNYQGNKEVIGAVHLTENQGASIHITEKEDLDSTPVVNVFSITCSHTELGKKFGLNSRKTSALIRHLKIREIPGCYSIERVGKSSYQRYFPKAIRIMKEYISDSANFAGWDKINMEYSEYIKNRRKKK